MSVTRTSKLTRSCGLAIAILCLLSSTSILAGSDSARARNARLQSASRAKALTVERHMPITRTSQDPACDRTRCDEVRDSYRENFNMNKSITRLGELIRKKRAMAEASIQGEES